MSKIGAEIVVTSKTDAAVKGLKDVGGATTGVRKAVEDASKGAGGLTGQLGKMQGALEGVNKKLAMIGSIASLGGMVGTLGALASGIESVAQRSRELAAVQQGLKINIDGARQATGNLVSDYQLMTAANKATTLGVVKNQEEFAKLAGIAAKLGSTMGQTTGKSVDDLTTALGRQSVMILDNLGISMKLEEAYETYARSLNRTAESLTDAEKKEAFLTVAMQKAEEAANKSGVTFDTHGAKLARISTAWENLKDRITEATATGLVGVIEPMSVVNSLIKASSSAIEAAAADSHKLADELIKLTDRANGASAAVRALADATLSGPDINTFQRAAVEEKTLSLARERYIEIKKEERARQELVTKAERERNIQADLLELSRKKAGAGKAAEDLSASSMHRARDFDGSLASVDIALDLERRMDADRQAALERQIADEQVRLELMQMEAQAMDEKSDSLAAANDRIYQSELRIFELQKQATTDQVALFDLEVARKKKSLQQQIDAQKLAQAEEKKVLDARRKITESVTSGIGDALGQLALAAAASADGEANAGKKALAAFLLQTRNQMIVTAAREAVLAIASAARYDYGGAALHGAAAAAATGVAILAGGAGAAVNASIPKEAGAGGGGSGGSLPASRPGGGGSGGSGGSQRGPEYETPVSFDVPRGVPRAANGAPPPAVVVNGPVIGEGGRRELGRYFRDVSDQADPRRGWR
jgi:hypothetical protein